MVNQSREIPRSATEGICGLLFSIAILAAATRTIIQLHTKAHLAFDDILLFVASILLVVSTVLFYKLVPGAYEVNQLEYHPPPVLPPGFGPTIVYNTRILDSHTVISWGVILTVKFCFLSFFRPLIDRVNHIVAYWRFVLGMTALFAVYSVCEIFIACPRVSVLSTQCLQGSGFDRTFAVAISVMLLDISTDMLIISIPLCLLWKVKIRTAQKFGIGVFLCLSIFMIMVAIIKVAGLRISGKSFDLVWDMFWQQVEASVAVITVSFTAFRAVLVARKSRPNGEKRSGLSYPKSLLFIFKRRSSKCEVIDVSPSPGPHGRSETSGGAEEGGAQIKSQHSVHWWNMGIVTNVTTATEDV